MSVSTRTETGRPARRVHEAERVKSGAAQRAYARRRHRSGGPAVAAAPPSELTGRVPFVAAILAMFGCGLVLTLVLTTRAAEDSYQLSDAREANRVLSDERAALQREVAAADSAPELADRARELGMIPAVDPARLVVGPDGTVTVIGEPVPAQGPPAPPLNAPPRSTAPRNGADPGERVVPVPAVPDSESGEPASGSVLAAPEAAPEVPGAPAGAAPPNGVPAQEPEAAAEPVAPPAGPAPAEPGPRPAEGAAAAENAEPVAPAPASTDMPVSVDGAAPGVPTPAPEPAVPAGEGMR
ncbi:hypothetical protein [Nocardia sp. X0981]